MEFDKLIHQELEPLRKELQNHRLYSSLKSMEDIQIFTQYHVFAVWDFMSLLKSLQSSLTCVSTPWVPNSNSNTARFINEIVLGEESDVDHNGKYKSHFDMYIAAMQEIGSDTSQILNFISHLKNLNVYDALKKVNAHSSVVDFVEFTFDSIKTKKTHVVASVFTFGREDLIADMFIEILKNSSHINQVSYDGMIYYLERHIELDGDEHGPMSMKMIEELCCGDNEKINDVIIYAKKALSHRIKLWDAISDIINSNK